MKFSPPMLGFQWVIVYISCMKKQEQTVFDVIVIGGGPSGLAFVKALSGRGLRVAVVDPAKASDLAEPAYDGRETALTHLSHKILTDLGVFSHFDKRDVSYIKRAHVINGDSDYALRFDHREAGQDTLGFMVSNQAIRRGVFKALEGAIGGDVALFDGCKVRAFEAGGAQASVTLDDGLVLRAALVVGADGRFSASRRMAGIACDTVDWGRTCLVGIMDIDGDHKDTAFECFHYDRTLAVLPLNDNRVSVVITLPSKKAEAVMAMAPSDFNADIEARFEGRVGKMSMIGTLHSYPLACTYAKRFYGARFALLGDAAVGMHPVTAHGYNLGVRGADILARRILEAKATGGDIGSRTVLAGYDRAHQLMCKPLYLGTNTLVRLYTDVRGPAKVARAGLLKLGNLLKPARDVITRQLTQV